jgi:hypothetical protein
MTDEFVQVVAPVEAQRWLGVSVPTYRALARSGLLGRITTGDDVYWEDPQHYQKYGTQWPIEGRPGLPSARMLSADFIQSMPPPPDTGDERYPGVQTWFYVWREGVGMPDVEEALETDTGWLAHFYLTPNPYMWPAPTTMAMVAPTLLKLRQRRTVLLISAQTPKPRILAA